jgi:cytochrome c oxidase subunit I
VKPAMPAEAAERRLHYLNVNYGVKSWLLTTDHKRIALLYLATITLFFAIGGIFAVLIRLELLTPAGDLVQAETYNKLFTMHGVIMVFFFLIPSVPAVLGNFLVPIMIGARDLAFPRLNLLSWYILVIGASFTMYAVINGGLDTGWTFYTPYSTNASNTQVLAAGVGIFITGFSSILTGLNFLVTIHRMRAPGMTWFRLPLFIWAQYATSLIMVLGTPVLAITVLLLAAERVIGVGIFDPKLGGDPVLFQHLFWFYSHPAVYIMILPSMGVVSELVTAFSRKRIFGYPFIAMASLGIAVLGFLVWGHHMFVSTQSVYAGMIFSILSFLVAIPSAVKVFNWTATLYKGSLSFQTPMLYAFGFIGLFTIGGLTGLFLATLGLDVHVHDTYFIVAHFHYIMVGGVVMGYLGGLHFWWPKITGRMYPEFWAKISALNIFIGFNLTFFPQFILGYLGMPRRYHAYPDEFQVLNVLSSAGASILAVGYLIPLVYLLWSLRFGRAASPNPWGATGLEWQTPSPPPTENFTTTPIVTQDAYDYPGPGGHEPHGARVQHV